MAIALRSASTPQIGAGSGTTLTGVEPTGTVQNDVVWALWIIENTGGNDANLPSGWTSVASRSASTNFSANVGYIVRGASAPSYAFTSTLTPGHYELFIWSLSGQDTTTVVDNAATPVATGPTASAADPPAVTASAATDWVIVALADWSGASAGGWGAPTGYTSISDSGTNNAGSVARKALSATGTEDPGPFSGTPSSSDFKWVETVAVKAAAAGGTTIVSPVQVFGSSYAAQRAASI